MPTILYTHGNGEDLGTVVDQVDLWADEGFGVLAYDFPGYGRTGVIDLAAILDEALKHGFTGNVSIEYEYNWETSVLEIAQCVGYLRAYSKLRA